MEVVEAICGVIICWELEGAQQVASFRLVLTLSPILGVECAPILYSDGLHSLKNDESFFVAGVIHNDVSSLLARAFSCMLLMMNS